MATFNPTVGTRTALAFTGLSTLASATYVKNTTAYNCNTNKPMNVVIEVEAATTNTPSTSTGRQLLVFIKESLDGTNYREGPDTSTIATRENNLRQVGVLPITTASTTERGLFDIFSALGFIPYSFYVVIKNDLGVALTSATVYTSEIAGVST